MRPELKVVQQQLRDLGYYEVGNVDGRTQPVAATAPQATAKSVPTYMPAATVAAAYRAS